MIDAPSTAQNIRNSGASDIVESGKRDDGWINTILDIGASLVQPLSVAGSSICLPRSPHAALLCLLDNITHFFAHPAIYGGVTTASAPFAMIGSGAHLLASGVHRAGISNVRSFLRDLPGLRHYQVAVRKALTVVVGRIRDGLQSPEDVNPQLDSLSRFLNHPDLNLLNLVLQVFAPGATRQKPVSMDQLALRARKALALLEQQQEWVAKCHPQLIALNNLPLRTGRISFNKQKKNAEVLIAIKESWNAFINQWFRHAELLKTILTRLADSRTHTHPLLPLLEDALPLVNHLGDESYQQSLSIFSQLKAQPEPQHLFGSDKNPTPTQEDEFQDAELNDSPEQHDIYATVIQQPITAMGHSVGFSQLATPGWSEIIFAEISGLVSKISFPTLLPATECFEIDDHLATTVASWSESGDTFPILSNVTQSAISPEADLQAIIWHDIFITSPTEKIFAYSLLSQNGENLRLPGLQDFILDASAIKVADLLNAYVKLYPNANAGDYENINEYEFGLFVRTVVGRGRFNVSEEVLINAIINHSDRNEWVGDIFRRAIIAIDEDVINYGMRCFYNSLRGDVKIADLPRLKKQTLGSLHITPDISERYANIQAEKIANFSASQSEAIRNLIGEKISEQFPLADLNHTDGMKKESHPYMDYNIFSVEGFQLMLGASFARAFGLDIGLDNNPQTLNLVSLHTLLNAEHEVLPPDSDVLFDLYFEHQHKINWGGSLKSERHGENLAVAGWQRFLFDLYQRYRSAGELFSAFEEHASSMGGLDKDHPDVDQVVAIREKFATQLSTICKAALSTLSNTQRELINSAFYSTDNPLEIHRLIISINNDAGNALLNAGSLLSVKDDGGFFTALYLLSPSMIINDLINPGVCEIPLSRTKEKDMKEFIANNSLYFLNKFLPHRMAGNEKINCSFAVSESQRLQPASNTATHADWLSQAADFTAETSRADIFSSPEKKTEALPQPEARIYFWSQVYHESPLQAAQGLIERFSNELSSNTKEVVTQIAHAIPFAACVGILVDLKRFFSAANNVAEIDAALEESAQDGLTCAMDITTNGMASPLIAFKKFSEDVLKKIVANKYSRDNDPLAMRKSSKLKKSKTSPWIENFKQDPLMVPFVKKAVPVAVTPKEMITADNIPASYVYSGVIYNHPDESWSLVFREGNEERFYRIGDQDKTLTRESSSYEIKYSNSKMTSEKIDNTVRAVLQGHASCETLKQVGREEIKLQRLDGYAIPEDAFEDAFPLAKKLKNVPVFFDKTSGSYFLKRNDGYLRFEKSEKKYTVTVTGEYAPADLWLTLEIRSDGRYQVTDDYLIRFRTLDEGLEILSETHKAKPVFKSDIILSRMAAGQGLEMQLNQVVPSPFKYVSGSTGNVKFILTLEDSQGALHRRIGPDGEGKFVPLDDEQGDAIGLSCRNTRGGKGRSVNKCNVLSSAGKAIKASTTAREQKLNKLYNAFEEHRNSESATFAVLQSLNKVDKLKTEPEINDRIRNIIDKNSDSEGAEWIKHSQANDYLFNVIDANQYSLQLNKDFWKSVEKNKKMDANDKALAKELQGICHGFLAGKSNKKTAKFRQLLAEYKKEYLNAEQNSAWQAAVVDAKTKAADYNMGDKGIVYDEDSNALYKKLGRASDETFSSEYPEVKSLINQGIGKTRKIATDAIANGKKEADFWQRFTDLTAIHPDHLSPKTKADIRGKFDDITRLSSELHPGHIVAFEEYHQLTTHHLADKSTLALKKELEICGADVYGYVGENKNDIHLSVNNFREDLTKTLLHENGHRLGDNMLDAEFYIDLDTDMAPNSHQNLPTVVKTLCHSPLAFTHYLNEIGEGVDIICQKVLHSLKNEINERHVELANLSRDSTPDGLARAHHHRERIDYLEKFKTDLVKKIKAKTFDKGAIKNLMEFLFQPENQDHKVAGLINYPDMFTALIQNLASPARVRRAIQHDATAESGPDQLGKRFIHALARRVFSHSVQNRSMANDGQLLTLNFFTSPSVAGLTTE